MKTTITIDKKNSGPGTYSLDYILKNPGVWRPYDIEYIRLVIAKTGNLFINTLYNRCETVDVKAWKMQAFVKCDEVITITFS